MWGGSAGAMQVADKLACLQLLDHLKEKHYALYSFFAGPALAVLAPSLQTKYQTLVPRPRDLEMIRLKINQGIYADVRDFAGDVNLCFENAKLFCSHYKEFKGVHDAAVAISKIFNKRLGLELKDLEKQQRQQKGKSRPSSSLSSSSFTAQSGTRGQTSSRTPIHDLRVSIAERVVMPLKVEAGANILLHPVPPNAEFYSTYRARILEPMDLSTVLAKLQPAPRLQNSAKEKLAKSSGGAGQGTASREPVPYAYVDEFCYDMRRMFANAIRYNYHSGKVPQQVRRQITAIAVKFEHRWLDWNKKQYPEVALSPPLAEMRVCLAAIEEAFRVNSSRSSRPPGTPAVEFCIDPVTIQLGEEALRQYLGEVGQPMDYGTIVSRVLGAEPSTKYGSSRDFLNDVKLVTTACVTYWGNRVHDGYIADAQALQAAVETSLASTSSQRPPLLQTLEQVLAPPIHAQHAAAPKARPSSSSAGGSSSNGGASLSFSVKRNSSSHAAFAPLTVSASALSSAGVGSSASSSLNAAFGDGVVKPEPVFYYVSTLEKNRYFLPPFEGDRHESAHQLERRGNKYVQTLLLGIIEDEVQKHYMKTPAGKRIPTCNPFVAKVDQRPGVGYPQYGEFLKSEGREEVCLQMMARKVRSGQYGLSLVAAVQDIERLRSNAHGFNVGPDNIETRIMADCVSNYFSYLIKICLTALLNSADLRLKQFILTPENIPLMDFQTPPDVFTFLQVISDDNIEEQRKHAAEQARRKAPPPPLPVPPAEEELPAFEDGLSMDESQFAELFDFDQDLSNSIPLAQFYDGQGYGMSGTGKGKGKGKGKAYAPAAHIMTEWELAAKQVLNKICRHPFVDPSRRLSTATKSLLIADFFRPVASGEYQQIVQHPMDLSILGAELDQGLLLDPEDFYDKITRVFLNLVKFNEREGVAEHEKQFSQEMVIKGNHLARYCKWLCLELLPCKSSEVEARHEKPELLGELRESVKMAERKAREELLMPAPMVGSLADIKKLLTNLKRTKGKADAILMGWFCEPPVQPSDYAVYVRRPMDLGTVGKRLDSGGYRTYGDVISDMRLVFQNSIKYNAVHMAVDKGSKEVHDAAKEFLNKLHDLLPSFSLDTAEHVERDRIVNINFQRFEMENYQRRLQEQQQLALFQEEEKQRRLDQDAAYRADQDVQQKKAQSLIEQKEYEAQQKRLRGEMQERAEEAAYDDGAGMAFAGLSEEAQTEQLMLLERRAAMRLQGLGPAGSAPSHLLQYVDSILCVRTAAWNLWEPLAIRGNQPDALGNTVVRSSPSPSPLPLTAEVAVPLPADSMDVDTDIVPVARTAPSAVNSATHRKRGWVQQPVSAVSSTRLESQSKSVESQTLERDVPSLQMDVSTQQKAPQRAKIQSLVVAGF